MKLKTPELFFSPRVLILKDEATKTEQYEVYYVFNTETKDLLYIGSGKKDRHRHVFSGASQNVSLNVCMICSVPMTITVRGIASKEEFLAIELEGIKKLNPKFNGRFSAILNLSEIDVEDLGETLEILLSKKEPSLKTLCELYAKDSDTCKRKYPEWFLIIDKVGIDLCKSYQYNKRRIMALYKASEMKRSYSSHEAAIYKKFKIGQSYSSKYIKDTLTELGIEKAKGTSINRWFDTIRSQVNGKEGYRIIRKL